MLLVNATHSAITLNHGGERISFPPRVLVSPNAAQEKALKDAMKRNAFFKALLDAGKIRVRGKGLDPETPLEAATNPRAPEILKADAEKNGKRSKVKKLERDGEMAV